MKCTQLFSTEWDWENASDADNDSFGNWIAGFIDGEGCFCIRSQKVSMSYTHSPQFRIKLRIDDRDVLLEIVRRTKIGYVKDTKRGKSTGNPFAEWLVVSKEDVTNLCCFLMRYPLRAKKKRDFIIWKKAVTVWHGVRRIATASNRGGMVSHPLQGKLAELKNELQSVRLFVAPPPLVRDHRGVR
jgi:hypothetical protein